MSAKIPFFVACALVATLAGCTTRTVASEVTTGRASGDRRAAPVPVVAAGDVSTLAAKCTDHANGTTTCCTRHSCVTFRPPKRGSTHPPPERPSRLSGLVVFAFCSRDEFRSRAMRSVVLWG